MQLYKKFKLLSIVIVLCGQIIIVNCSNCRPLNIRTVDTNIKTDINFARIAITRQIFCFKNTYGRN